MFVYKVIITKCYELLRLCYGFVLSELKIKFILAKTFTPHGEIPTTWQINMLAFVCVICYRYMLILVVDIFWNPNVELYMYDGSVRTVWLSPFTKWGRVEVFETVSAVSTANRDM